MNETVADPSAHEGLSASVKVLPLPTGLYLFSVKSAEPSLAADGQLRLPAIHIGLGPGARSDGVEFVSGPTTHGAWLIAQNDLLVLRVGEKGTTVVLTSVRAASGASLAIRVERLDDRRESAAPHTPTLQPVSTAANSAPRDETQEVAEAAAPAELPVQVSVHVRSRGDMSFQSEQWAGRIATGLWLESFSIMPLKTLSAADLEYKGLTGSGFETPWLSDNRPCGTKGMAVPLVGFAVRLKPSPDTSDYNCEYSGYFKSGSIIGPLRNGAPCRSTVANDPLEGIQFRLRRRDSAANEDRVDEAAGARKPKSAQARTASAENPGALRRLPTRRS